MRSRRRRRPLRHVVAALGLATIGAVAMTVARQDDGSAPPEPRPVPSASSASPLPDPARTAARPPSLPVVDASAVPAAAGGVRAVSAPGITPFPTSETPPIRIAPPKKPEPPPAPIRPRRLMPIVLETTAEFTAGDIRVRLPGVGVVAPDETCRDRAGTEWPCGRRALAGIRALVRGKAVECPLPDKVRRGSFVVDCTIGGADLAERIVASGWARALDRESSLTEAERRAEANGLGLHAAVAPSLADALPMPAELPPDATTAPLGTAAGTATAAPQVPEKTTAPLGAPPYGSSTAPLGAVVGSVGRPVPRAGGAGR